MYKEIYLGFIDFHPFDIVISKSVIFNQASRSDHKSVVKKHMLTRLDKKLFIILC